LHVPPSAFDRGERIVAKTIAAAVARNINASSSVKVKQLKKVEVHTKSVRRGRKGCGLSKGKRKLIEERVLVNDRLRVVGEMKGGPGKWCLTVRLDGESLQLDFSC
jgi:hypothetical protein